METALIIGASGGIGSALVRTLEKREVKVTSLSRSADGLDVTDEASVKAHLGALSGPFDLIFVATGALELNGRGPEKALKEIRPEVMLEQFRLNCMGPALVLKEAARLLPRDCRTVFAALSARVGSIGDNHLGGWYSYRTAKAALNQMIRGASIELKRTHRQSICVALHPGTVATLLTSKYAGGRESHTPDAAARDLLGVLGNLEPKDTGSFFDWSGKPVPW
ncbi:SDR family NAD(P)-dependent oxidoreductase [Roseovarius phycicola]|uniref:SDR family NAD(P)-dependent oxidoreductase n=1 Tax=Roseovarius phycicola TaxID=3080976 RepID=A0ABZ2HGZ9_9RHOB